MDFRGGTDSLIARQLRIEMKAQLDQSNERFQQLNHQMMQMMQTQQETQQSISKMEIQNRNFEIQLSQSISIYHEKRKTIEAALLHSDVYTAGGAFGEEASIEAKQRMVETEARQNQKTAFRSRAAAPIQHRPDRESSVVSGNDFDDDGSDRQSQQPTTDRPLACQNSKGIKPLTSTRTLYSSDDEEDNNDNLDAITSYSLNGVENRGKYTGTKVVRGTRAFDGSRQKRSSKASPKHDEDSEECLELDAGQRDSGQQLPLIHQNAKADGFETPPHIHSATEPTPQAIGATNPPSLTKIVILRGNPRSDIPTNPVTTNKARKSVQALSSLSNIETRPRKRPMPGGSYPESNKEPPRKNNHRLSRADYYGHRPATRNSVPDSPPLEPLPIISTSTPSKLPSQVVSRLPKLVQGKRDFVSYYKGADEAFKTYSDRTATGQHNFVNHFLKGIRQTVDRNAAIQKLQALQESTIKQGKPWITCEWEDVLEALVSARLITSISATT